MMSRDLECYKCSRDIPAGVRGGVSYNLAQMRLLSVFLSAVHSSGAGLMLMLANPGASAAAMSPDDSTSSFIRYFLRQPLFSFFLRHPRRGEFSYKSRRVQRSTWTFTAHHPDGAQHRELVIQSNPSSSFKGTPSKDFSLIAISLEN